LDTVFDVLANRRRRAAIQVLRTAPRGSLDVDTLADGVVSLCDNDPTETESALYHTHLPKLDATDIVDYDTGSDTVEYNSDPIVERCLDVAETFESDSWIRRSG
jgi:hypothetical protein